ncbi:hypothetical protein SESBI_21124 [Sesbania bispinosa]|nr:hypothetical protein SESBI_21124 [Sesbania bispinosa]
MSLHLYLSLCVTTSVNYDITRESEDCSTWKLGKPLEKKKDLMDQSNKKVRFNQAMTLLQPW